MSYDIHGNVLKEGYCEVHPYVPEYYPCYICCQEIDRENQRKHQLQPEQKQAKNRNLVGEKMEEYITDLNNNLHKIPTRYCFKNLDE